MHLLFLICFRISKISIFTERSCFRFTLKRLMGNLSFPALASYDTNPKPLKIKSHRYQWGQFRAETKYFPDLATPLVSPLPLLSLICRKWKDNKYCAGMLAQSSILLSKVVFRAENMQPWTIWVSTEYVPVSGVEMKWMGKQYEKVQQRKHCFLIFFLGYLNTLFYNSGCNLLNTTGLLTKNFKPLTWHHNNYRIKWKA